MVASFDAAASDSAFTLTKATVETTDSSCFMRCDPDMTNAQQVKKCLESITISKSADCTSAIVTLDYGTEGISDCSAITTTSTATTSTATKASTTSTASKAPRVLQAKKGHLHFASNALEADATGPSIQVPLKGLVQEVNSITGDKNKIKDSDIKIISVTLGHTGDSKCTEPTIYNSTDETICGSQGTPVSMTASDVDKNIKLTAKNPVILGNSKGLLAQWKDGCSLKADSKAKQSIRVQATVTVDPSPINIIGTVKFNDGCSVEGCEKDITTPKQAQSCLTSAAADTKCETANYTRTLTNARTVQCSTPKHPLQLTMSLSEIFEDETDVTSKADSTIMKDVYFGKKGDDDAQCGVAKIYLTDGCVVTSDLTNELPMTKDTDKLRFTGGVPLLAAAQQKSLLVAFVDKGNKCTVSKDLKGDTITFESSYTIAHDAPSGVSSLARVPFSALVMAVSSIAFVVL